jgi:hypothetical protein
VLVSIQFGDKSDSSKKGRPTERDVVGPKGSNGLEMKKKVCVGNKGVVVFFTLLLAVLIDPTAAEDDSPCTGGCSGFTGETMRSF